MTWLIWVAALFGFTGIAWLVYRYTGEPLEEKHCVSCNKITLWDTRRGCRECYWADQQL